MYGKKITYIYHKKYDSEAVGQAVVASPAARAVSGRGQAGDGVFGRWESRLDSVGGCLEVSSSSSWRIIPFIPNSAQFLHTISEDHGRSRLLVSS